MLETYIHPGREKQNVALRVRERDRPLEGLWVFFSDLHGDRQLFSIDDKVIQAALDRSFFNSPLLIEAIMCIPGVAHSSCFLFLAFDISYQAQFTD